MTEIQQILPLLAPIALIQLGLQIYALIHLVRRRRVRFNNKWLWGAVILFLGILGPILYFVFRGDYE
jgi:heme/copper-type cytochrome/quinol oxidase subunit 4